jgi:hypothetical protein
MPLRLADNMIVQKAEDHMTLFNKVFSTRTLLQIICVLGAVVVMKALSAHYDFSWATAASVAK